MIAVTSYGVSLVETINIVVLGFVLAIALSRR